MWKTLLEISQSTSLTVSQLVLFVDRYSIKRTKIKKNGRAIIHYEVDDDFKNQLIEWQESKVSKYLKQIEMTKQWKIGKE